MRVAAIAGCLALLPGCGGSGSSSSAPAPLVPAAYQTVYQELQGELRAYRDRVNTAWDGATHPVTFASALLLADSHAGPALLSPDNQMAVLASLDQLKALGAQAVVVQINYPLLAVGFVPNAPDYVT